MGIEPYLVASSLEAVLAQRLVRLICPNCKQEFVPPDWDAVIAEFGENVPPAIYCGKGCRQCQHTGYRGRTGIFEMMTIDETIRSLILENASGDRIRQAAINQGMNSLRQDGWRLILEGRTTVEEVLRVTKDERINGNGSAPDNGGGQ